MQETTPVRGNSAMKPHKFEHLDQHSPVLPLPFLAPLNGAVTEALERNASLFSKSVRTFQDEAQRFVTRRLEDNVKAMETFCDCKTFSDLVIAQQRWFSDMVRAYYDEGVRFSELLGELSQTENGNGAETAAAKRERHSHAA
jgi:hypothetical protein